MLRRWVCGVVVVAMILGSLGWSVPAMAKQPEPSDYYVAEFLAGEVASLIGGISLGGAVFLVGGLWPQDCGEQTFCGLGPVLLGLGGALLGSTVGAGLGVTLTGYAKGVEGNGVGAYIGSFLGTGVSMGLAISAASIWPILVVPTAFAVIGYNSGAKMKDTGQPTSLPWTLDLPVLLLEW